MLVAWKRILEKSTHIYEPFCYCADLEQSYVVGRRGKPCALWYIELRPGIGTGTMEFVLLNLGVRLLVRRKPFRRSGRFRAGNFTRHPILASSIS